MAPKEMSLVHGMVALMLHFGWTWVGLAISDDEKGMQFLSELRAQMDRNGVCVAFFKNDPCYCVAILLKNLIVSLADHEIISKCCCYFW